MNKYKDIFDFNNRINEGIKNVEDAIERLNYQKRKYGFVIAVLTKEKEDMIKQLEMFNNTELEVINSSNEEKFKKLIECGNYFAEENRY